MPVVGTLTVDLVAKTASFESGMDKASGKARRTSKDIQDSFNGMDFGESRGGLMLIDELIGIHIPRHATAFASQIPGLMQAFSMAMPLAAIAAIGVGIADAVEKAKKKQEELREHTAELGIAISGAFNSLDQKLLNAGIRADVLNKNHLAELKKRLELINLQSMDQLAHSFDVISKAADKVFADLTSHWYSFGIGSEGARNALAQFRSQYDALLAKGESKAASDLLAGTLQSAEKVLAFQKQYIANQLNANTGKGPTGQPADYSKFEEAALELKKAGVTATDAEVKSQQALVDTLKAQVVVQGKVAELQGHEITAANQKDVSEYNEAQIKKYKILQDAMNASMALGEKRTESDIKGIEKANAATIKAIDEQLALYQRIDDAKLRIATLTREIGDQEAIQAQKMAVATGHMTEQKAVQEALKTLERNKAAELAEINSQLEKQLAITQQLDAATNGGRTGTDDQKAQYLKAVNEYQNMEARKLQITKQFNAQIDAERLKAANTEQSQWRKMALEFGQIQKHMSELARQTLGQMNSSIAAFVVTGQGNFRQLAISAAESFIQMALEYVESKTIMLAIDALFGSDKDDQTAQTIADNAAMALSAAGLAASNTLALTSATYLPPVPEALSAAALALGLGYAATASAARGAVLPNREMLINTHPEEMILPQHIANFVVNAASNASGGGRGGNTYHISPVFAPVVSAIDATGVDRMLKEHGARFHREFHETLRRMNY